jgi:hypothetical protein
VNEDDLDTPLLEQLAALIEEFERLDAADSIYAFQTRLADAIIAAEPNAFADKRRPERDHLRRLRLLGDGLAWRLLHPYTIRQLAKNNASPPSIADQEGFAATMGLAKEWTERGAPVVVCDLTSCLRVADVAVCADPERPLLLESGGHPRWSEKGRKARQKQRRLSISQLLYEGQARLADGDEETVTVPIATPLEYSWHALEQAIHGALEEGTGVGITSDSDVIVAMHRDVEFEIPPKARALIDGFAARAFGFIRVLDKPDPRVPPPIAWPITVACRTAVLCSEVFVVHVVDVAAMYGQADQDCAILGVETSGTQLVGFRSRMGASEQVLSAAFLDDVLVGFQTLDSTCQQMLAFVRATETMATPAPSRPWPPPTITMSNVDEARSLVERPDELDPKQWVALPLELWDELRERRKEPDGSETD